MDSLLSILKEIQLRTTEVILQLQSVTLAESKVELCEKSLKKSDILKILSKIEQLSQNNVQVKPKFINLTDLLTTMVEFLYCSKLVFILSLLKVKLSIS